MIAVRPETALLRYTVKPQALAEHLQLLDAVYAELDSVRPTGFSWATYRIDGTLDFVEVATGRPLPGPLPDLPSFRRYRAGLDDRCSDRRFDDASVVGAFSSR